MKINISTSFPPLVLFILTCFAASTHAYNRYSTSFSRHINRRLQCGIMKNLVTDPQKCRETCAETLKCFSINTYRYDNGTQICELIKGSKDSYKNEDCLEWKTGWEHNEFEYTQSCPVNQKQCNPKRYKKALPDGWYQLGSIAFKLFPEHLLWHKAVAACTEKGAVIAQIRNDEENQFVGLLQDKRKPGKPLPLSLRPLAHWNLDNTDENLWLLEQARFQKDIDGITTVLHLPGTGDSHAETPSYDIRGTSFTVSFWVSLAKFGVVYGRWGSPHHFAVVVKKDSFNLHVITEHRRKDIIMNITAFYNRWTHYTAVWNRDKATGQLYVNGNQVQTQEYNETYTKLFPDKLCSKFDVGFKRHTNSEIKANLSQLYLFDRALTGKEVELVRDSFYMGNSAWIGLNDIDTEGQYKTHDNSQVASYLNFAPGQIAPDVQDCVSVRAWDGGRMDMNHCQYTALPYICMKQV